MEQESDAIVSAARDAFPGSKPDLLWYTAGGNDLASDTKTCMEAKSSQQAAHACVDQATAKMMACTETLLKNFWKAYPDAKVGQYNYDMGCTTGECLEGAAEFLGGQYCLSQDDPTTCMEKLLEYWQSEYVDALQKKYPKPAYTGMNVLGTLQKAAGISGAETGHLVLGKAGADWGSKCSWMISCVHPKYGTPAATGIADAMWDLWLSNIVTN